MKYYVIFKCDYNDFNKILDVVGVTTDYNKGVDYCKRQNEAQSDYFYKIQYRPKY